MGHYIKKETITRIELWFTHHEAKKLTEIAGGKMKRKAFMEDELKRVIKEVKAVEKIEREEKLNKS